MNEAGHNIAPEASWLDANQRHLVEELNRLSVRVAVDPAEGVTPTAPRESATAQPWAIDRLVSAFALSPFERTILLLCAGIEMDGRIAEAAVAGGRTGPSFALALTTLEGAHWSALAPDRPLRRWRMIEVEPGSALVSSRLRIDERILHFLAGLNMVDARIAPLVVPHEAVPVIMTAAHRATADRLVHLWHSQPDPKHLIHLSGEDAQGAEDIATAVAARLGLQLYMMNAETLPSAPAELDSFATLWQREAMLLPAALLIRCGENPMPPNVASLAEMIATPLLLYGRDPRRLARITRIEEVRKPDATEQKLIWRQSLGAYAADSDNVLESIVSQYRWSARDILRAAEAVRVDIDAGMTSIAALRAACRGSGRRLDELAARIEPEAVWHDLVLPEPQFAALHQIAGQVRQRRRVYEEWGFGRHRPRGLGVSVLFSGESGTGKTLAAEVLAAELALDLYRIDLSAVVSKYIGETEKNLRRVFDAAEDSGAILLFDEADALFGKRSDVKDSHDRYANIEVSYLLQRMEAYRGLAILTTNLKSALDPAFQRRLRFVVHFPFPDAAHRAEIWRRAFPPEAPTDDLDFEKLARLNVAGGGVRNISLNAAFLAADAGEKLAMRHLLAAAQSERAKQERPLAGTETRGWT